ncbi:MAG: sulfatase-like hydrolase/transferase, partial [Planctomycetaceae bacterium]|nr:sulfatase-like hydrolase/transferase [Planctomycetaceae bacterium]
MKLKKCLPLLLILCSICRAQGADDRPNIVWILSEDNSTHYMRLYGDELGVMPTVERLAAEGLTFDHA